MKNNTHTTKSLLTQALQSVPGDFALSDVKVHIRNAIQKLEQVEQRRERRERREQPQQITGQWPVSNGQVINPYAVKHTIDKIEEMIAAEKKNIDDINKRRKTKHDNREDGEDLQAIFG